MAVIFAPKSVTLLPDVNPKGVVKAARVPDIMKLFAMQLKILGVQHYKRNGKNHPKMIEEILLTKIMTKRLPRKPTLF